MDTEQRANLSETPQLILPDFTETMTDLGLVDEVAPEPETLTQEELKATLDELLESNKQRLAALVRLYGIGPDPLMLLMHQISVLGEMVLSEEGRAYWLFRQESFIAEILGRLEVDAPKEIAQAKLMQGVQQTPPQLNRAQRRAMAAANKVRR